MPYAMGFGGVSEDEPHLAQAPHWRANVALRLDFMGHTGAVAWRGCRRHPHRSHSLGRELAAGESLRRYSSVASEFEHRINQ
jgi:hypothetical protein